MDCFLFYLLAGKKIAMCLIYFAYDAHPEYLWVLAGNRDEFYARPTKPADYWDEADGQILGGRDLEHGGTWLAISTGGRFATVTNYRDPQEFGKQGRSRGLLLRDYLTAAEPPGDFLADVATDGDAYAGFNVILADFGAPEDASAVWYYSNRSGERRALGPGFYGLSNAFLDTAWPKVADGTAEFRALMEAGDALDARAFFEILSHNSVASDERLPDTGIGLERERWLSSRFIQSPVYGTRASTFLTIDRGGHVVMHERRFGPEGSAEGEQEFSFQIEAQYV